MRITVYDVLGYLASGMSQEEILADLWQSPLFEVDSRLRCLLMAGFLIEPTCPASQTEHMYEPLELTVISPVICCASGLGD
jgi:hypothetical protein